jgi:hypothetical protein
MVDRWRPTRPANWNFASKIEDEDEFEDEYD